MERVQGGAADNLFLRAPCHYISLQSRSVYPPPQDAVVVAVLPLSRQRGEAEDPSSVRGAVPRYLPIAFALEPYMIDITTLGREAVRKNGGEFRAIAGHRQKFALLAYIAIEGPVSRDRLLAMFWPERPEGRARHSLSQALYALRRELNADCLHVQGDSLVAHDCRVDIERVERAAERGDWETVISLYGGPFLDQFVLPGAPEFDAWQTQVRTRLARVVRRAFPHAIERRMTSGKLREALALAASWVKLDPLEDEAQHILITLLARSGQRNAALEQFDSYKERLSRELGVEPLDGTVALVERVRAGAIPEYRPLSEPPRPAMKPKRDEAPVTSVPTRSRRRHSIRQAWESRIVHVAVVYLLIVWLGTRLVGDLIFHDMLPDWVLAAVVFALVLGLPIALVITWAHETPIAGESETEARRLLRLWPHWAEGVRGGQVAWFLSGIALVLVLATAYLGAREVQGPLSQRVVIYPFAVPSDVDPTIGEDMATWVGSAFESNGGVGWIDGWYRLGGADVGELQRRTLRSNALALGAAFWLQGRIRMDTDSVRVYAQLHTVLGDHVIANVRTSGPVDPSWIRREGESIARQLLPPLLGAVGETRSEEQMNIVMPSDTPVAADSFLVGEQLYRRLQFGRALARYESAVEHDSSFSIAALKGAMAATWLREWGKASTLVDVTVRRSPFLEPARSEFAHGLQLYLTGHGEQAIARFTRAVELAPEWVEARAQLGEAYYHLFTRDAPADSLAWATFREVRSRNPGFYPVLYHLIQIALREGDIQAADSLMDDFRRLEPDTAMVLHAAQIMYDCVRRSPDVVDWNLYVVEHPGSVSQAAANLAAGGRQVNCARAAWTSILRYDKPAGEDEYRRFGALLGLAGLLSAEGRWDDLALLLDAYPAYYTSTEDVIILVTMAGGDLEARAADRARMLRERIAARKQSSYRLWLTGLWAVHTGRLDVAQAFADSLASRAVGDSGVPMDTVLARSVSTRLLLARGDSAAALEILQRLVPPVHSRLLRRYPYPWESRPWEPVTLAELLLQRGRYREAIQVAGSLDSPARPPSDLTYLPHSLAVRVRAAEALGDQELAARLRARLAELGRMDMLSPERR